MSELAFKLLSDIQKKHNEEFSKLNDPDEVIAFSEDDFIKLGYNSNIINNLLIELSNAGYIEMWASGQFILK